jgi:hypothetical protein
MRTQHEKTLGVGLRCQTYVGRRQCNALQSAMISHEIETYRDFRVLMTLDETPTHWVCQVSFERRQGMGRGGVPRNFERSAEKSEASGLRFSMEMQRKARARIDGWLARRNG